MGTNPNDDHVRRTRSPRPGRTSSSDVLTDALLKQQWDACADVEMNDLDESERAAAIRVQAWFGGMVREHTAFDLTRNSLVVHDRAFEIGFAGLFAELRRGTGGPWQSLRSAIHSYVMRSAFPQIAFRPAAGVRTCTGALPKIATFGRDGLPSAAGAWGTVRVTRSKGNTTPLEAQIRGNVALSETAFILLLPRAESTAKSAPQRDWIGWPGRFQVAPNGSRGVLENPADFSLPNGQAAGELDTQQLRLVLDAP